MEKMVAVPIEYNIQFDENKIKIIIAICIKFVQNKIINESNINEYSTLILNLFNNNENIENIDSIINDLIKAKINPELIENKQIKETLLIKLKEPQIYTKKSPIEYKPNWIYPNGNR